MASYSLFHGTSTGVLGSGLLWVCAGNLAGRIGYVRCSSSLLRMSYIVISYPERDRIQVVKACFLFALLSARRESLSGVATCFVSVISCNGRISCDGRQNGLLRETFGCASEVIDASIV